MGTEADKVYGTVHVLSPKLKLKAIFFKPAMSHQWFLSFCMIKFCMICKVTQAKICEKQVGKIKQAFF